MNYSDYLLIKDLPGYPKGCIFTIGDNYIYYIKYNPETVGHIEINPESKWDPCRESFIRFNIYQMENNPEWFLKIDEVVKRDMMLDQLLNNIEF